MKIIDIVKKYNSYSLINEYNEALAASDIILSTINGSHFKDNITIKGGILMLNITGNKLRPTTDLDFDLIHYSIDAKSIEDFINKLNETSQYEIKLISTTKLHQKDYEGIRTIVNISDETYSLPLKMDIGVHVYTNIEQDKLLFMTAMDENGVTLQVNPKEQVIVEKVISLAMIGSRSTRYKDIYDIYTLLLSINTYNKLKNVFDIFLDSNKYPFKSLEEVKNNVAKALLNKTYSKNCAKRLSYITDIHYETMKETIIFLLSLLSNNSDIISLNNKERDVLIKNLNNPPEPNDNIKKLM